MVKSPRITKAAAVDFYRACRDHGLTMTKTSDNDHRRCWRVANVTGYDAMIYEFTAEAVDWAISVTRLA